MKVVFWGVRGSIPSPLTGAQVQSKINAVVQRIQPKDLVSPEARQKFLAQLPEYVYGTAGGNTPCVQLKGAGGTQIVFDAGTGIRNLGACGEKSPDGRYSIIFSHLHWDHIQGLPFFAPIFGHENIIDIYSAIPETETYLYEQLRQPFLPESLGKSITTRIHFHTVIPGQEFEIGGLKLNCCRMSHPGSSFSYSVEENGRKLVYATDVELYDEDYVHDKNVESVFGGADLVILDSQYTPVEAVGKKKWGHSPFCYAVDFASELGVKKVCLFHHEPSHDDRKLDFIVQSAREYARLMTNPVGIDLAVEGGEINL